jgi:glycyl-tRNA synthetase
MISAAASRGKGKTMKNQEKTMDRIVALCKNRGFIFAGSEIYGGLANTWDYGPLGAELKNNVKKAWWKKFVQENQYNVGLDAAILMNPQTWVASGHLSGFSDPLMDCRECKERFRADKLIENWANENGVELPKPIDAFSQAELKAYVEEKNIPCPTCGKHNFTDIRQFNLMFKTFQGVTEDAKNTVYLRPETAQGIFVNFANVARTTRRKLPFGIGQIGKSFRNEITPGNFIFRVREFEQMELEFFCQPGSDLEWFDYWRSFCHNFLLSLGLKDENLRMRDHTPEELVFYSKATTDFEFLFPFGWGELWGVADRTDYDLNQHQKTSGQDLTYYDQEKNEHYIPYVIEPSLGVDRAVLALLVDAYDEEVVGQDKKGADDVRTVLHLAPALAPYKCAILPLSKKEVLTGPAIELYNELSKEFMCDYDETGSIGKRYRRADEIGTPFCITFDFDTVGDEQNGTPADNCVTIRERDSMEQVRLPISQVKDYIAQRVKF